MSDPTPTNQPSLVPRKSDFIYQGLSFCLEGGLFHECLICGNNEDETHSIDLYKDTTCNHHFHSLCLLSWCLDREDHWQNPNCLACHFLKLCVTNRNEVRDDSELFTRLERVEKHDLAKLRNEEVKKKKEERAEEAARKEAFKLVGMIGDKHVLRQDAKRRTRLPAFQRSPFEERRM